MMMQKKSPLGRGLGALINDNVYEKKTIEEAISTSAVAEIEIDKIEINPFQPRKNFDEEALKELSESIKQLGIIQPITVRKLDETHFQLISGERRFRASKLAGLTTIPAFVRDANDKEMLEFALVENIQREDLNAIEIAVTYQRLIDECNLTQETLAERVGKKRPTISNYLRLLKLSPAIQAAIRDNLITMGHAKALVNIEEPEKQLECVQKIIDLGLSVRDTEKLTKEILNPVSQEQGNQSEEISENSNNIVYEDTDDLNEEKNTEKFVKDLPENYTFFRNSLSKNLNAPVDIKLDSKGKGKIVINFKSDQELNQIIEILQLIQ